MVITDGREVLRFFLYGNRKFPVAFFVFFNLRTIYISKVKHKCYMEKIKAILRETGMVIAAMFAIVAAILAIPSVLVQSMAEYIRVKCQNTPE